MRNILNHFKTKKESGFTLIELLVVISIIGILVVIVIVAINPIRILNDSRDVKRKSDMEQIKTALQSYYNDQKAYPASLTFGSALQNGSVIYMKQVPSDGYTYKQLSSGQGYYIYADLNTGVPATRTKCDESPSSIPNNTTIYAVCND